MSCGMCRSVTAGMARVNTPRLLSRRRGACRSLAAYIVIYGRRSRCKRLCATYGRVDAQKTYPIQRTQHHSSQIRAYVAAAPSSSCSRVRRTRLHPRRTIQWSFHAPIRVERRRSCNNPLNPICPVSCYLCLPVRHGCNPPEAITANRHTEV